MSADFAQCYPLRRGRAHEVCGAGATYFAATCCNFTQKPVMWISPAWQAQSLNPVGLSQFCNPAQILLARARTQVDQLAVAEDSLRSGAVGLVICEVTEALTLTHGRRLQLAAEAGRSTGLVLMPEGMGNNATETRWHCTPLFAPRRTDEFPPRDSTRQRWDIIKNKSGTLASWVTEWDATSRRVIVVSKTGE